MLSVSLSAQDMEQAMRWIKLGNTYRISENYPKAGEYLKKGMVEIQKCDDYTAKYWEAVANEYYAYLYEDIKMYHEAMQHYDKALAIYETVITQKDGSPFALKQVIKDRKLRLDSLINSEQAFLQIVKAEPKTEEKAVAGEEVVRQDTLFIEVKSKSLTFDNQKLKDINFVIPDNIETISARSNRLKNISPAITRLPNLKSLDLEGNRLKEVSATVGDMKKLEYLNLSDNMIKELPDAIGELQNLKYLDLSGNRLKALPATLGKLKNLKVLDISKNKLPFTAVENLIKQLPNTNIIHDIYSLAK
jgi:tetratricopeptide (TPR) repeat protein